MPNWKKLILSGSDAALNSLNVTTSVTAASFTGSFSGSVAAPGSTTQVVFNNGGTLFANSGFVYSGSNVGIGTTSPNSRLVVQGSGTTSATSALNVTNSTPTSLLFVRDDGFVGIGTTTPTQRLDVQGNIAITKVLLSNQENLDVDSGATRVIATISSTLYDAAFFDFVIKKGTNLRAGTLYAVHNGTTTEFTETSTQDLGNTSDVTLSADISGGNIRLLATTLTDDWIIKTLVRGI
jgi:hypothetical protein